MDALAATSPECTSDMADSPNAELEVAQRVLSEQLSLAERELERVGIEAALEVQAHRARIDELERALEAQAAQSEGAQQALLAMARQHAAAAASSLEEELAQARDELARRDSLQDDFGAEAELAESDRRAAEVAAKLQLKCEEVVTLQQGMAALQRRHEPQLRRLTERSESAEAAAAAAEVQLAAAEAARQQMESQLVRLSEGFNRQVDKAARPPRGRRAAARQLRGRRVTVA